MLANIEQSSQSIYNLTLWRFQVTFFFLPWKQYNALCFFFFFFLHIISINALGLGKMFVEQKMLPLIFSTTLV